MFPRDNEAAWINRPGNGMHLRGKSRDRERESWRLKRLIRCSSKKEKKKKIKKEKDIEKYLKKNRVGINDEYVEERKLFE